MNRKLAAGFSTIELLIILVVAGALALFIASKYSSVQQKSRDDERRSDINSLQFAAQSYFAQTGNYPTLAQFNNAGFRKANLPSLPEGAAQDPKWTASKPCTSNGNAILENSATPLVGCYGYTPSPTGCDNKKIACTDYRLTAKLENGSYYTKSAGS